MKKNTLSDQEVKTMKLIAFRNWLGLDPLTGKKISAKKNKVVKK